ncbi:MAG: transcriptional repressor [Pseudomonadota bacterium]
MPRRKGRLQEEVLAALRQHDHPQSAYALLALLREQNPKLAPTSVYRALAALSEQGQVHRIESLNAFVVCQHTDHGGSAIMAICDDCGSVEERVAPGLVKELSAEAAKSGFAPTRHVIELHGHCAACDAEEAGT